MELFAHHMVTVHGRWIFFVDRSYNNFFVRRRKSDWDYWQRCGEGRIMKIYKYAISRGQKQ